MTQRFFSNNVDIKHEKVQQVTTKMLNEDDLQEHINITILFF